LQLTFDCIELIKLQDNVTEVSQELQSLVKGSWASLPSSIVKRFLAILNLSLSDEEIKVKLEKLLKERKYSDFTALMNQFRHIKLNIKDLKTVVPYVKASFIIKYLKKESRDV
jgi:hypothetical protein